MPRPQQFPSHSRQITQQIHQLKQDLGVELLLRTSRGVHLTPTGVTLYTAAQRMLAEADRVRRPTCGTFPC
jgi:LysR family nitrogen assimilation transcriptional regulator